MTRFADYTLALAQQAVAASLAVSAKDYRINKAFVEDKDHWQDGDGFIGLADAPQAARTRALPRVRKHFTPVDIIGEVADRFSNALLKTQADVQFVPVGGEDEEPTDQQQQEAADMLAAVSSWWDDVRLWDEARKALARSRWAGTGSLRRYVPREQLARETVTRAVDGEDTSVTVDVPVLPSGLTFADALRRVRLTAEEPNAAAVVTDADSLETVAIFLFREGVTETSQGTEAAEVWVVDNGTLRCRILRKDAAATDEFSIPGVAVLPIAQMTATVLITPIVCQEQRRANYFESVLVRTIESAGFRERSTINAAPELEWSLAAPTDTPALETIEQAGKTWYGYPKVRTLGSGTQAELRGIPIKDQNGVITGLTTPAVVVNDPVDPAFAITGCEHARASILKDCHQAHVLGAENLQRSGISIQQARSDFADDLTKCKAPLEQMIAETVEGAIATASVMSSEFQGFLSRFRVVVTVHPNPGPLTPEERLANMQAVDKGLMSDEEFMARDGIEDTDAERQRILASPMGSLAQAERQAKTFTAWLESGADVPFAAKKAGLDEADAAELAKSPAIIAILAKRQGDAIAAITTAARLEGALKLLGITDSATVKLLTQGADDPRNVEPTVRPIGQPAPNGTQPVAA